ncbi:glycosyltransferase, partial [Bacillus subtilis]|uniref:glycosyltransferase n=1 Tax=Bacillus subtilis TaxID=1423 RepID=UPI00339D6AB3
MAAFLGTELPAGRARVIPNPLPFDAPAAADLRPPNPSPGGVVEMGFVGRLSPEKEPARLLALLRSLPERFRLTVVGDGPLRATLEAAGADLVAQGRLAFAGERPRGRTLSPEWRLTVLTS